MPLNKLSQVATATRTLIGKIQLLPIVGFSLIIVGLLTIITKQVNTQIGGGAGSGIAGLPSSQSGSVSTCTNQFLSAAGTCASVTNATITNSTIDLTAKVTGVLPLANGGTASAAPGLTTLVSGCGQSGTNATASATNVSTCAITGLTALDKLRVYYTIGSTTQSTASVTLVSATDTNAVWSQLSGSAAVITALNGITGYVDIAQRQTATTKILTLVHADDGTGSAITTYDTSLAVTTSTAWTGSYTLAIRTGTGGVTSGGTFDYTWNVYKIAGQ